MSKIEFKNLLQTPRTLLFAGVLSFVGCASPGTQDSDGVVDSASSLGVNRDVASTIRMPTSVALTCSGNGSVTSITVDGSYFEMPSGLSTAQRSRLQAQTLDVRQQASAAQIFELVEACLSKSENEGLSRFEVMKIVDRESGVSTDSRATSAEAWMRITKENLTSKDAETSARALGLLESIGYRCPELGKEKPDRRSVRLTYPGRGLNRNKNGDYSVVDLEQIAADALSFGVDPFLAMSIAILENPPIANATGSYKERYGRIPVDAIAAYDLLGCLSPKSARRPTAATKDEIAIFRKIQTETDLIDAKVNRLESLKSTKPIEIETAKSRREILWKQMDSFLEKIRGDVSRGEKAETEIRCFANPQSCHAVLNSNGLGLQLDLRYVEGGAGPISRSTRVCSAKDTAAVEARPVFRPPSQNEGTCCADVTHSFRSEDRVPFELMSWLGIRYVQKMIQSCVGRQSLESCIQKFNGEQCLGCTEKLSNDCYSGLIGSDRPIYGARAADVMVNVLIANPEIQNLIARTARRLGQPVPSALCLEKKGATSVSVDPKLYVELQKKFILGGESENFLAAIRGQLRRPQTESEQNAYKERERHRANVCRKYFE